MNPRTARHPSTLAAVGSHPRWESVRDPVSQLAPEEVQFSVLPFPQEPMLARSVVTLPDGADLVGGAAYEPKFDGYRALIFVEPGWCRIQSRYGRDITTSFPDIAAAVVEHVPSGVVLDGELVVWGDDTSDFTALHQRLEDGIGPSAAHMRPASFVAFDVLAGAGMDMRRSPFRVRRQALTILLGDAPAPLHVVPQTRDVEEARTWIVNYAEAHVGVDGVVAKGLGTPYSPGERGWHKLPIRDSIECIVGAVVGSLRAPTHLLLGLPDSDGLLHLVGGTSEMTLPQSRRLGGLLAAADDSHPWTSMAPVATVPGWPDAADTSILVAPMSVVEVAAGGSSPVGAWLEPRELIRSRPELLVAEVEPGSFAS